MKQASACSVATFARGVEQIAFFPQAIGTTKEGPWNSGSSIARIRLNRGDFVYPSAPPSWRPRGIRAHFRLRTAKTIAYSFSALCATCLFYVGTAFRIERHLHRSDTSVQRQVADNTSDMASLDTLFSLIWPAGPIICVLIFLYPRPIDLRCTSELVQVMRRSRGRVTHIRSFPVADVKRIQDIAETLPWLDAPGCLGFFAAGKRVTCLPGLKCIEAEWVLDKMQRMGFHVQYDPGLPEMIEKEQSRRRRT